MEYFKKIEEVSFKENIIAVLGNFDGCHKGHQELIKAALKRKAATGAKVLIVTFDPHSKDMQGAMVKRIQTLNEKLDCFESLGVDGVLTLPFTEAFSKMDRKDFLANILMKDLGVTDIVIGHDYRFGYKGAGDVDYLETQKEGYGYTLIVVPAFKIEGTIVSSTQIRQLIEAGAVTESHKLLGYYPLVTGKVVHGAGVGKTLGFATANLLIDADKIIPKVGVYGVIGIVKGKSVKGFCNVGYQPTFDRTKQLVIEVHFFDFDEDIYEETITVYFVKRIRDEKKFNSIDELKEQLRNDQINIENQLNGCYSI